MNYVIQKFIKPALLIALLTLGDAATAQISLINDMADKLEKHSNFSYQSISKKVDITTDTTMAHNKEVFMNMPGDVEFGYFYSVETDHKTEVFHRTDLYAGNGIQVLSHTDTTFFSEKAPIAFSSSLLGGLKFLKTRYAKSPFPVTMTQDTLINGMLHTHLIAKVADSIDNNERIYALREFYINKQTGLPAMVVHKSNYKMFGKANNYYNEIRYFDYRFDQSEVKPASFAIPAQYSARKEQNNTPVLLSAGTTAPDWTLFDANGKKLTLSELKGKVVLLDFYFIGCKGCMLSLEPLNRIYEKYKNRNVIIASLTARDSKQAVLAFDKRYKIKYASILSTDDVTKKYNVTAFPTFYFINKDGKIANSIDGYEDDFEKKVVENIDKLL